MKVIAVMSCLPLAWSHAFMTIPASRNLNQCPSVGKHGITVLEFVNNCLAVQDRSNFAGACADLPCAGCVKFPLANVINFGGGHNTCTPGNYPGKWYIKKNVCGVFNEDPLFVLPAFGPEFKKDEPQVTWQAGSVVDVEVKYVLNHAGNYQFRLCLDGSDTEECFNELPLKFEDGQDWHWIKAGWFLTSMIKPMAGLHAYIRDKIVIPDWVECDHCTLNWRWDTALEASVFSNCADISITGNGGGGRSQIFNFMTSDGLCMDIPGSNTAASQPLWIWDCAGSENQQFTFADGSWQITTATDVNLCVDAGSMTEGEQVTLAECNGFDQQVFGYDADFGTIYLANTGSDASLCLKPEGGWDSAAVTVVSCDTDDYSQHWDLSELSKKSLRSHNGVFSNHTRAEIHV